MDNYVITIARGFGSGGKQVGLALSKKLGIPCYESQILQMASNYSGISKDLFFQVDEKLKGYHLIKRLMKTPNNDDIAQPTERSFISDVNLYNIQAKIIKEIGKNQSCIIIGKCANHLLRSYENTVSVYIEAPRAFCVKRVMERLGVTEEEAHKTIYQTDKYRSDYYKYYTGGENWTNPVLYDMTLNSERMGLDKCSELIVEETPHNLHLQTKTPSKKAECVGKHSIFHRKGALNQTVRDFLAARYRFANANIIFNLAVCFRRPRYRVFRYRKIFFMTAKICSTLQRTDDF